MSETNNTSENQRPNFDAFTQEEKISFLKTMFNTLEIDNKAIFANWCHEEVEKGASELLGEKMNEMNEKLNKFVAKAYDKVVETGSKIYHGTNTFVEEALRKDEEETKSENTSEGSGIFD